MGRKALAVRVRLQQVASLRSCRSFSGLAVLPGPGLVALRLQAPQAPTIDDADDDRRTQDDEGEDGDTAVDGDVHDMVDAVESVVGEVRRGTEGEECDPAAQSEHASIAVVLVLPAFTIGGHGGLPVTRWMVLDDVYTSI